MRPSCITVIFVVISLFVFSQETFSQGIGTGPSPTLIEVPDPVFPPEALQTGLEGKVSVLVTVDKEGRVVGIERANGPHPVCPAVSTPDVLAIRRAASDAALMAKFSPALHEGNPVTSFYLISFDLPKKPKADEGGEKHYTVVDTGSDSSRKLTGGVLNGKAANLPKPPYPPAARAINADGQVTVEVVILEDGSIFSAAAISGHPLLRPAARQAACDARFSQTLLDGKPFKVSGVITYNFVRP